MAEAASKEETPKKKGGMKKIIMLAGGVLLLAGVGFGGMIIGKSQGAKAAPKGGDAAAEVAGDAAGEGDHGAKEEAGGHGEAKKEEGGHGEAKKEEGGHGEAAAGAEGEAESLSFAMDKLTVNLADASGRRYVQASLQLQASSPKALKEIEANKAPIIDATLTLLATKTREDLQPPAARERLKRELMTRLDGILTPKSVENIYITQMVFQ